MKKLFLFFVSTICLSISSGVKAQFSADTMFTGLAGQDSIRVYENCSGNASASRIGWLRYGNSFANQTANVSIPLGSSQLSFLITGLTAATDVPVKFCGFEPTEGMTCYQQDTFKTADPPFITTVDLINGVITDSGLVLSFDLNTTAPAMLQPIWDAALVIGSNPTVGNIVYFSATSGTETKSLLVQNWFAPDTYAVAIRFQNDSLVQIGQFGYSDTIVSILNAVSEAGQLPEIKLPTIANNLLFIDVGDLTGDFYLLNAFGQEVKKIRFERKITAELNDSPGLYFIKIMTKEGKIKSGKLLIIW